MVGKGKKSVRPRIAGTAQVDSMETATAQPSTTTVDLEAVEPVETEQGNSEREPSPDLEQPNDDQLESLRQNIARNREYIALLEQDQELRRRREAITQAERLLDEIATSTVSPVAPVVVPPPPKRLRFNGHKTEYSGRNLQELRRWLKEIGDDQELYSEYFTTDKERVFHASKALKYNSTAYKHWATKREQVDSLDAVSWSDFLDVLYDALGSKTARKARAYYDHIDAKWDPKKQSIMEFYAKLLSYEASFANFDEYLYYHLWKQIPEEYKDRLVGTNKPATRDEIVKAIEELDIDRKRDRSQSDATKQSENKRPKPNHKPAVSSRNTRSQSNSAVPRPTGEGSKNPTDSKPSSGYFCNHCKKSGHTEIYCRKKNSERPNAGQTQSNPNRVAIATVSSTGKDQVLRNNPPKPQRQDQ